MFNAQSQSINCVVLSQMLCSYRGGKHKTQSDLCICMSVSPTYAHTLLSSEDTPTLRHISLIPTLRRCLLKRMQKLVGISVTEARTSGVSCFEEIREVKQTLPQYVPPLLKIYIWLSLPQDSFYTSDLDITGSLLAPPILSSPCFLPNQAEFLVEIQMFRSFPTPWLHRLRLSMQIISFCLCS